MRAGTLFGSLSSGVSCKSKYVAWKAVAQAVNEVGGQQRSLKDVKKKWSDLKLKAKKRIAHHRASVQATGGGSATPNLTPEDDRIAAIIGESAVVGVYAEGDTDLLTAADSEDEVPLQRKTAPSRPVSQMAAAASVDTPAQEESSRPSPSSTSGYRSQARVLTDVVLQSQRDLVHSVNEVVAELRQLRQTLVQMNQTLVDCLNKRV
ncbi:hypothetical protein SKAU_G00135480 [Synaphobranchus kaupii]|uniref:Myb/SANT-like DNA-binding domain-containing protein n=1 Tax=Synaphobranchus kaupii TaxID=118154 RepID=A0A9Q1FRC9_SYNKA|nr:hypothetical protein SKAU_G00135480 [Synaphobranchus kaupii]